MVRCTGGGELHEKTVPKRKGKGGKEHRRSVKTDHKANR